MDPERRQAADDLAATRHRGLLEQEQLMGGAVFTFDGKPYHIVRVGITVDDREESVTITERYIPTAPS